MKKLKEEIRMLKSQIVRKLSLISELKSQNKDFKPIIKEIWKLSKKKFVLQSRSDSNFRRYKGLIFTVGLTPEPIILNIIASEPEAVYFIYTEESEKFIDTIIEETNLKPSQYKRGKIPKDSIITAFRLIKEGLNFLCEDKRIKKLDIALDPTGGTKIMSVGCGVASSIMDLDILYVSNTKYNVMLRRPEPGSEKLVNLPNLQSVLLGDKLIEDLNISRDTIEKISEYFKDITSTHIVLLIKKTGELLSEIRYIESHNLDADVFSGLITAITDIGGELRKQLNIHKGDINSTELEFNFKGFMINLINGEFIRLAIISDEKISELMKENSIQLVDEYEAIHFDGLRNFNGEINQFNDFLAKAKERLDLNLNEKCSLNLEQIHRYDKNITIIYILKRWYNKMKLKTHLTSFYPILIPKVLIRELGITREEANYWTYDLFRNNMYTQ